MRSRERMPRDRDRMERVPRPDFGRMHKLMRTPVMFDGRNSSHRSRCRARVHLLLHGAPVTRCLVTGGAGYIGSHAAKASAPGRLPRRHLRQFFRRSPGPPLGAPLVEGDIRDADRLRAALTEQRVDAVMHFAAWLSVGDSVTDPVGYYRNNVIGALAVLDAAMARRR